MNPNDNIFFDRRDLKKCGKNVIIGKTVRIRHPEKVSIGNNVIIDDFCYISGEVEIGDYVHVAASCSLQASEAKITIGAYSGISSGCRVFAATSNYAEPSLDMPTIPKEFSYGGIFEETIIESHCLLGANCVVLTGVHIPEGTAFGAGIVIRKKKYESWRLYAKSCGEPHFKREKEKYLLELAKLKSASTEQDENKNG